MRKADKRQPQGDLFAKPKRKVRRGKKLGRPRKGPRAAAAHKTRPEIKPRTVVHAVLRVASAVGSLRKRFMYRAVREATIAVALRELAFDDDAGAFRIVHISIQRTHVHLIVEADNKRALSRGMQSFQISAAKHINHEYSVKAKLERRRRGTVFPDRFHQQIITNPLQARRSLAYVLNNWRKHQEDRGDLAATWPIDPFSSAIGFTGWRERETATERLRCRESYRPLVVYEPRSWLLREGWLKHGKISFYEVPSAPPPMSVVSPLAA